MIEYEVKLSTSMDLISILAAVFLLHSFVLQDMTLRIARLFAKVEVRPVSFCYSSKSLICDLQKNLRKSRHVTDKAEALSFLKSHDDPQLDVAFALFQQPHPETR